MQGTEQWRLDRCGNATASMFSAVIAKGEGKTRMKYLRQVVAERLTGKPCETFRGNWDTDRGKEQEPMGKEEYEARTGNLLRNVGFIKHPTLAAGCSPDALVVAEDGGYEGKAVIPTVQVETLLCRGYPSEHKPQVQGCLWITERAWWDFTSYCPDMLDERHQLYVFRVQRDEEYIAMLAREVAAFLGEADRLCDRLAGKDDLEERLRQSVVQAEARRVAA